MMQQASGFHLERIPLYLREGARLPIRADG